VLNVARVVGVDLESWTAKMRTLAGWAAEKAAWASWSVAKTTAKMAAKLAVAAARAALQAWEKRAAEKAAAEAEAAAEAQAKAMAKIKAVLTARARVIALRKAVKRAQAEAIKDPKGVLMQQWRDDPIEPKMAFQVVLRYSTNDRWKAIHKLFANVNPKMLGHGKDQQEGGSYNAIVPVAVFDIHYGDINPRRNLYLAERAVLHLDAGCSEYGTSRECARTDKALASVAEDDYFPPLNDAINEKMLVHGTSVDTLPLILGGGFDRRFGSVEAYGHANYQAEDPGKADQYVVSTNYQTFNDRLGIDTSQYKNPKTFYMLISRTLLGCANHVKSGGGTIDFQGKQAYDDKKLLRIPYDSLIVEHGSALRGGYHTGGHYREFLVQSNERILPVMLVAYVRETKNRPFDPSVLGCP
jgi:hypothetical protein